MQTELKQAVCKTVALGPCGFKSLSADLYAAVPQWWRSCLEGFWSVIPACGFDPRLWRYTGMCANRAGSLSRKQVIRKGLGVRIPPSPLLSRSGRIGKCTCLLSRGRLFRHPGSGPGSGALNDVRGYVGRLRRLWPCSLGRLRRLWPCSLGRLRRLWPYASFLVHHFINIGM